MFAENPSRESLLETDAEQIVGILPEAWDLAVSSRSVELDCLGLARAGLKPQSVCCGRSRGCEGGRAPLTRCTELKLKRMTERYGIGAIVGALRSLSNEKAARVVLAQSRRGFVSVDIAPQAYHAWADLDEALI